jgi:hypothetical protein
MSHQFSQPGWTGSQAPLGTCEPARRTTSAGPSLPPSWLSLCTIASRRRRRNSSSRASVIARRCGERPSGRSRQARPRCALVLLSPVSMGTIETGALRLAQRQVPRDFATISLAAKVRKNRLCGAALLVGTGRQRLIRNRCNIDCPETQCRVREDLRIRLSRCLQRAAARSSDIDRARPAPHPVEH